MITKTTRYFLVTASRRLGSETGQPAMKFERRQAPERNQ